MNTVVTGWESVLRTLIPMCTVICLAGASLLFHCSKDSRSRRLLAYIMLLWGLYYGARAISITFGTMTATHRGVLLPFILIGGNLYVIILLLYPLEVLRPGWLNPRRGFLIMLPYLGIVGIYYIMLFVLGESSVKLRDWNDFFANAGQFNVWYRLVILLSVVAYVLFQLYIIYRYEVSYKKWCESNYSSPEKMEASWLRYYGVGVILIGVAYFWGVFGGGKASYVFHNIIVQIFFCFTFYKGFFHENPYSESFFRHTMDEEIAEEEAFRAEAALSANVNTQDTAPEHVRRKA